MKKYILLTALLCAVLIWLFVRPFSSAHPFQFLPPYTSAVTSFSLVDLDSLQAIPPGNQLLAKDIKLIKQASAFWVDNQLSFDPQIFYAIDRNNDPAVSALFLIRCRNHRYDLDQWTSFIPSDQKKEHRYRKRRIVHLELKEDDTFFGLLEKGVLLLSADRRLLERCIALRDEGAPKLWQTLRMQGLDRKREAAGLDILINSGDLNRPEWHRFQWFSSGQKDSLSGRAQMRENSFHQNLLQQEAADFSPFLTILPDRLFYFDMISINYPAPFFRKKNSPGPQFWSTSLTASLGKEMAYVEERARGYGQAASFLVFSLNDADQADRALRQSAEKNGLLEDFTYQKYPIVRMLAEEVSGPFFQDRYPELRNPYWTIAEGFLICSNDIERLKLWLDYIIVQRTLIRSDFPGIPLFQYTGQRMSGWRLSMHKELDKEEEAWWRQWSELYPSGLLRWTKAKDIWEVQGLLDKKTAAQTSVDIPWRRRFGTSIQKGPWLVRDPRSGKGHSLWVQDADDRLFVYDLSGRLLWERPLNGPVLDKPEAYIVNPAEWSTFFNTERMIYEVNDKGELIYTIPLKNAAGQGLRMTYFEEPNDPHFFLPAQNEAIYGYNRLGDALVNWNPQVLDNLVGSAVYHMASRDADHLFWVDQQGGISAKYRNGEDIPLSKLPDAITSLFFFEKNNLTYVLGVGGELGRLASDLTYKPLWAGRKRISAYRWQEVENKIILLLSDREHVIGLELKEEKVNEIFRHSMEVDLSALGFWEKGGRRYYMTVERKKGVLQLFDEKGREMLSERLPSNGETAVFQVDGRDYLATGTAEELLVYELIGF